MLVQSAFAEVSTSAPRVEKKSYYRRRGVESYGVNFTMKKKMKKKNKKRPRSPIKLACYLLWGTRNNLREAGENCGGHPVLAQSSPLQMPISRAVTRNMLVEVS